MHNYSTKINTHFQIEQEKLEIQAKEEESRLQKELEKYQVKL